MKNTLLLLAGLTAAFAYVMLTRSPATRNAPQPVDALAHKLQDAWADHHTVA